MGYNRIRSVAAITGVLLIVGLLGCRTVPPVTDGFQLLSVGKDLDKRPLYTFNEAELGVYLSGLHKRIPDLKQRIIHFGSQKYRPGRMSFIFLVNFLTAGTTMTPFTV